MSETLDVIHIRTLAQGELNGAAPTEQIANGDDEREALENVARGHEYHHLFYAGTT